MSEVEAILPLVASQKGILAESAGDAWRYVGQQVLEVHGALSAERLSDAWRAVSHSHQALRSTFHRHGDTFLQVVRQSIDVSIRAFDLTVLHESERDHAVQSLCEEERDRGIDLACGAPVRLTLIRVGEVRHFLCLTHHHAAIDGRSLSVALGDLARAYDGVARPLSVPSLVDVVRHLVHSDLTLERGGAVASGDLGLFGPQEGGVITQVEQRLLDPAGIGVVAGELGVTPASVCISAWLLALAELRGDHEPACCLSRDRRPASLPGADRVVGMFTETLLLVAPSFRPRSAADGATTVLDLLTEGGGPPPLADGLGKARRAGASGRPDVLLTVYPSATLPPPPSSLTWRLVAAVEATEFAIDATIHLGTDPRLELGYDMCRASRDEGRWLANRVAALLEDPRSVPAGSALPRRRPRTQHQSFDAELVDRMVVVATRCLGQEIDPQDDLIACGWDSLALLALAVALSESVADVRVGDLIELGTLARLAARLTSPTDSTGADIASVGGTASLLTSIEEGLLVRSRDLTLGEQPLHEQSILAFDTELESGRLKEAFAACLHRFPSIDRWWEDGDPDQLRPRGDRPIWFASHTAPAGRSVQSLAADVAASDLQKPFERGCGPLVRLHLVQDGCSSAVLLAFHYAVLDGWSFGTFVRSLQDCYLLPGKRRGMGGHRAVRPLSGVLDAGNRLPLGDWLADISPVPSPRPPTISVRSLRTSAAIQRSDVNALAHQLSTSPATVVQALVGQATSRILNYAARRWAIALRMSVRDGSAGAGVRAVGQLTADVPLLFLEVSLSATVAAVTRSRLSCLGADRVGHRDFEEAIGCDAGEVATDTAIVIENYFRLDEWLTRRADHDAWPEASTWRRDVSPTWRTLTLQEEDGAWSLEIRTVLDEDPTDLLARLVDEIARLVRGELQ